MKAQKRIFVPTKGTDDCRNLLADPEKQWRRNYSAKCLGCLPGVDFRVNHAYIVN